MPLRILAGLLILQSPSPLPETLPNGARLILLDYPEAAHAVVVLGLGTGERDDPPEAPGLAHYLEHLALTAAAGEEPAAGFAALQERYAGQVNGMTLWDHSLLYWVVAPDSALVQVKALGVRIRGLRIETSDLERELPRLEEEVRNMHTLWPGLAPPNLLRRHLRNGPGGPPRGGDAEALARLQPPVLLARWRQVTDPRNLVLVVAGRFEREPVKRAARAVLEELPRADIGPPRPRRRPLHLEAAVSPGTRAGGPWLLVAHPLPDAGPEDFADACAAALAILLAQPEGMRVDFQLVPDPFILTLALTGGHDEAGRRLAEWRTQFAKPRSLASRLFSVKILAAAARGTVPVIQRPLLKQAPDPLFAAAHAALARTLRHDPDWWQAFDQRLGRMDTAGLTAAVRRLLEGPRLDIQVRPPEGD